MTYSRFIFGLGALAIAIATAADAQIGQKTKIIRPTGTVLSDPLIVATMPLGRQEEVELIDLPLGENVTEYDSVAGRKNPAAVWKVSRTAPIVSSRPSAIGTQTRSTMYANRNGFFPPRVDGSSSPRPDTCGRLRVDIGLYALRKRGFRVARATIVPVVPQGMALIGAPSIGYFDMMDRIHQMRAPIDRALAMSVMLPIAERIMPPFIKPGSLCHSEYYLHVWAKGPAGVDPYTGKPYPPGPVVH